MKKMQSQSPHSLIPRAFAVFAIAAAWHADPQARMTSVTSFLGFADDSLAAKITTDILVALLVVAIAELGRLIYNYIVWKHLIGDYIGGWWVYSLIARPASGEAIQITGYFCAEHGHDSLCLVEGNAFYFAAGSLIPRGEWQSDNAWIRGSNLRFVFQMHAVSPKQNDLPQKYEGFMQLRRSKSIKPTLGNESWCGEFFDLDDRAGVSGPVYAERLTRKNFKQEIDIPKLLRKNAQLLFQNLLKHVPAHSL